MNITKIEKYKSTCRIDIDSGWKSIIEDFLQKFEELDISESVNLIQIKQKLGDVRIYFSVENDLTSEKQLLFHKLVYDTEKECNSTCELCGTKENVSYRRPRFWIFKCCEDCYEKRCEEFLIEDKEKGRDVSHIFNMSYVMKANEIKRLSEQIFKIDSLREEVEKRDYFQKDSKKTINEFIKKFERICAKIICEPKTIFQKPILNGYTRIVIGGHGPYVECRKEHFEFEPIVEKSQQWRTLPQFANCKYVWLTHPQIGIKIYHQMQKVKYADYLPGYYYIDLLLFDDIHMKED